MRPEKPEIVQHYVELLIRLIRDTADHLGLRYSSFDRDIASLRRRVKHEGMDFLTKVLPTLGKALDKSLAADSLLHIPHGFAHKKYGTTALPEFLFELWKRIYHVDGEIRKDDFDQPGVKAQYCRTTQSAQPRYHLSYDQIRAVRSIRQICYLAYKLEYSYSQELQSDFLINFENVDRSLPEAYDRISLSPMTRRAVESARLIICSLLKDLNPYNITPRHGPGAVASGERQWEKYNFSHYFPKLDVVYNYADYFFFNYGHLCDELGKLEAMEQHEHACAKVVLVPKDSRGPRLISMEPLEIQWIQQGLARAMIREIEDGDACTCGFVNFTNQRINRDLAMANSYPALSNEGGVYHFDLTKPGDGQLVTLDMKEASDRVSLWLVRELFPEPLYKCFEACRSEFTELPGGHRIKLRKFAPMGSACCFPVEALVFWALAVGSLKHVSRVKDLKSLPAVYVYGDDLICRKADYLAFSPVFDELHLRFNEDKCCIGRFFRESCGCDAFKQNDVTPVRLHTLWPKVWSPQALLSYIAYANALRLGERDYTSSADYVESVIVEQFGPLPLVCERSEYPYAFKRKQCSREETLASLVPFKHRYNRLLQRDEWKLPVSTPRTIMYEHSSGWDRMWNVNQIRTNVFGFTETIQSGTFTIPHIVKMRWTWVASDSLLPD